MASSTTSATWMKGVMELLHDAGLDVGAIAAAAEIDKALLDRPEGRVATEKVSAVWRAAVVQSGDPAICMVGARSPKPGNFNVVGFAMLSSHTLYSALQSFSRHMRLVSDAAQIELEDADDFVRVKFHLFGGRSPIPRQRVEFDLLVILTFCRWVSSKQVTPIRARFIRPTCEYADRLAEAFDCPVLFDSLYDGFVFHRKDLESALPASNPIIARVHDNVVQQRLAIFDRAGLSVRVRDELARRLVEGEPRRSAIAAALHLSDRTLRRRLQEEGVSFEKLLDATRSDFAQYYLAQPNLSLAEIAYLLGFGDQSAFFRASRRWFGISPGQLRARLIATTHSDEAG